MHVSYQLCWGVKTTDNKWVLPRPVVSCTRHPRNKVPSKTWLSSTFHHCWIPEKKSKVNRARETNLKNKNLCSPFFWWNFLVQTFQDLHDFLHDFFKTPVGWSLLTTTYRPQGDQGDQGTHLACSTVSPWYSSRHSLHLNGCQAPFPANGL